MGSNVSHLKTNNMAKTTPIGAVIPYAGLLPDADLLKMGYMQCDGRSLAVAVYNELFQAIGTTHGGDGNLNFNIPDYRGRFLRGVNEGSGRDPDAIDRTAMNSGGGIGDRLGSIQGFGTANAKNPFVAKVPHNPPGMDEAYAGASTDMGRCERTISPVSDKGGDKETRPVNANVVYLIKVKSIDLLPVGTIINFAGKVADALNKRALFCNGSSYETSEHPQLREAIQNSCGGEGSKFNIPDYRGRFLRGKDSGTGRDPNAKERTAMNPGGHISDNVGSIQGFATAKPVKSFTFDIEHMPFEPHTSYFVSGPDLVKWNENAVDCVCTDIGGDTETRPLNANMEYYILSDNDEKINWEFPIGSVIGFAGNTEPNGDCWLKCDGAFLTKKTNKELFDIIGTVHGGDGAPKFALPDYRGRFIRGVDHGAGNDPDAKSRTQPTPTGGSSGDNLGSVQDWATGKPKTPITAAAKHLPLDNLHVSHAFGPAAKNCSKWTAGEGKYKLKGGDSETRPVNANIFWYIRYS